MDQAFLLAQALGISLDFLADDDLDEPPAPEITEDERMLVTLYRRLPIDVGEGLARLATPVESRPSKQPAPMPFLNTATDETEWQVNQLKSPAVKPKASNGAKPREGKGRTAGPSKKASDEK